MINKKIVNFLAFSNDGLSYSDSFMIYDVYFQDSDFRENSVDVYVGRLNSEGILQRFFLTTCNNDSLKLLDVTEYVDRIEHVYCVEI